MTRPLSRSISAQARPQTQLRTARVVDILEPATGEDSIVTGWQVVLDFGGGEVKRAGVASSYNPIPGDVVSVARYLNTLFVIDRVTAGDQGDAPGGRVGYAYYNSEPVAVFKTAPANTETAITELQMTVDLRNGAAYKYVWQCYMQVAVANQGPYIRVRADSMSGATVLDFGRQGMTIASSGHGIRCEGDIRNDTGRDVTVTLLPTVAGPPGGAASLVNTTVPRPHAILTLLGSSKLHPHAGAVPAPPEIT